MTHILIEGVKDKIDVNDSYDDDVDNDNNDNSYNYNNNIKKNTSA